MGEMSRAQVLGAGRGWVTFPWETIGGFLPPYPTVLTYFFLYNFICDFLSLYLEKEGLL